MQRLVNRTKVLRKKKLSKSTTAEIKLKLKQNKSAKSADMGSSGKVKSDVPKSKRGKRRQQTTKRNDKKRQPEPHQSKEDGDGGGVANLLTAPIEDVERRMGEWVELGVHGSIVRALYELKFYRPTEIQNRTIPLVAKDDRDIIGAAETVSMCVYVCTRTCVQACVCV